MEEEPRKQCQINQLIKIFCPHCGAAVLLPMQQGVNGELIHCHSCGKEFKFER